MPRSVLEAIKEGEWDFEPGELDSTEFPSTGALPGTDDKLTIMAERLRNGEPLWHPSDRMTYDDSSID